MVLHGSDCIERRNFVGLSQVAFDRRNERLEVIRQAEVMIRVRRVLKALVLFDTLLQIVLCLSQRFVNLRQTTLDSAKGLIASMPRCLKA